jgi:hypothetical protein
MARARGSYQIKKEKGYHGTNPFSGKDFPEASKVKWCNYKRLDNNEEFLKENFLKTLGNSIEFLEAPKKDQVRSRKKGGIIARKKQPGVIRKKIRTRKKFLEDNLQLEKSEKENGSLVSVDRRVSKEIRWKVPIDVVRNISADDHGSRSRGFFSNLCGYFCLYLPQKICPDD